MSEGAPEAPASDEVEVEVEAAPGPTTDPTAGLGKKLVIATVFGVLVFALFSFYGDVRALGDNLSAFRWSAFGVGLLLATANYGLRFVRWEYYLRVIDVAVPRGQSALIFVAGFVMSITPGKVGEVFKSLLLWESHGVPVARTAPIVVAERLTDLFALVLLTALGSLVFADGIYVAIAGGLLVATIWVLCAFRPAGEFALRVAARLPLSSRLAPKLRIAYESLRVLIRPAPLAIATSMALVSWSLECLALLFIADGFEGVHLGLLDAAFAYSAPTIVGALMMTPGGLGFTEAGMTGVLQTIVGESLSSATAVAITLLVRLATLWWAVLLGLFALVVLRARRAA